MTPERLAEIKNALCDTEVTSWHPWDVELIAALEAAQRERDEANEHATAEAHLHDETRRECDEAQAQVLALRGLLAEPADSWCECYFRADGHDEDCVAWKRSEVLANTEAAARAAKLRAVREFVERLESHVYDVNGIDCLHFAHVEAELAAWEAETAQEGQQRPHLPEPARETAPGPVGGSSSLLGAGRGIVDA